MISDVDMLPQACERVQRLAAKAERQHVDDTDRAKVMKWSENLERAKADRDLDALNSLDLAINLGLPPQVGDKFGPGPPGHHRVAGMRKSVAVEKALAAMKGKLF